MDAIVEVKRFELGRDGALVPIDAKAGSGLPIGTVLHWGGNMGWAEQDFCIVGVCPDTGFGGGYECFDIDHPEQNATLRRVDWNSVKRDDDPAVWHSQHFFVTDRICTPEEVAVFNAQHIAQRTAFDDAKAKASAETDRLTEIGKRLWSELGFEGATHVIIAEHEVDDSDVQTDYFSSHTSDTVVLARSEHGRDLFSELRKAALLIPETRHLGPGCDEWRILLCSGEPGQYRGRYTLEDGTDTWTTEAEARTVLEAAEAADKADRERVPFVPTVVRVPHGARLDCDQVEHREKYSGGHGFYLAQHRNSGWQVRKRGVNKDGGYFVALAKRHEHIVKRGKPVPAPVATGGNATVTENTEKGGIEIRFPSKPEQVVIDSLKANGWRWSKFAACWWIKASDEARAFAQKVTA